MSEEEERQTAADFIAGYADGDLDLELSANIEIIASLLRKEVLSRGKGAKAKGEIKLVLKFSAENQSGRDVVVDTSYELDRKEPKPRRSGDLFFVGGTKRSRLVREQPRQGGLPFPSETQAPERH